VFKLDDREIHSLQRRTLVVLWGSWLFVLVTLGALGFAFGCGVASWAFMRHLLEADPVVAETVGVTVWGLVIWGAFVTGRRVQEWRAEEVAKQLEERRNNPVRFFD
jgi:hypothetical protein